MGLTESYAASKSQSRCLSNCGQQEDRSAHAFTTMVGFSIKITYLGQLVHDINHNGGITVLVGHSY